LDLADIDIAGSVGFVFILAFLLLCLVFAVLKRQQHAAELRDIPAFNRLIRALGLAVEAGKRLHFSIGQGGILGMPGGSAVIGLAVMERFARAASASDRPPLATSGEAALSILARDTLRGVHRTITATTPFDPQLSLLTGLTPFSYAAGVLPVILDEQASGHVFAGHFGSEVALLSDAAERTGGLTLAGSDNLTAQAVVYATTQEPLIGEELFAAGAYLKANPMHLASLRTQDIFRWGLVIILLGGSILKLAGLL